MVADLAEIGAVFGCPAIGGFCGVNKIEDPRADGIALKADLGGNDALGGGGLVDRAVCGGRELHAVLFIENYPINGVRKRATLNAVENDVPDGDLAAQGLSPCLRADDAREPIYRVASVKRLARGDGAAAARDGKAAHAIAPFNARAKRAVKLHDGCVHPAVFHKDRLIVIKIPAVGYHIIATVGGSQCQLA